MSSINGIQSASVSVIMPQSLRERTDPAEKFKSLDSDSNGTLDKTELSELAKELSQMIGKTLNVDSSITTYDADNDGMLNQSEMDTMMRETLGPPPSGGQGPEMQAGTLFSDSTAEEQLSGLIDMLNQITLNSAATLMKPDPAEKFTELDSDSSGGLDESELAVMAEDIAAVTGQTVDFSKALSNYDADGDGELNQEEMAGMMQDQMKPNGAPPPPPPEGNGSARLQQALSAYQSNSGEDRLDQLRKLLEQMINAQTASDTTTTS